MHAKAKEWDAKYGSRWGDLAPMGRPCDWCGQPVTMGYLHAECVWVELDALNKEADARYTHRRKHGTGRPGTTTRVYKKYERSLTAAEEGSKLRGNKESSHEAISLSPEG